MRVLIIKTSSLGDIVHSLPVIDYLHQASPSIEIDWVVEEPFFPVLEHNPALARIHVIRTKKWRKSPFSSETRHDLNVLRKTLKERSFDLVFDIQGNLKSGLIAWLSCSSKRIGFSSEVLQEKVNRFFINRQIPFRASDLNVTDRYLRIVSVPFGRDYPGMDLASSIFSSPEDETAADSYMTELPDGLVFFFQIGTTWPTKLWYPEGWRELAQRIGVRYPDSTILLNWGNPGEKALAEHIASKAGKWVRLLPWLTIRELIPLIRKVDLVIGGDTGPVYLAAAVGTPTVSYYRATNSVTYAPVGEQHIAVQTVMPCAGCRLTSCDKDDECRHSITVDALMNAIIKTIG